MKTPQRTFIVEFKSGRRPTKGRTNSIWGDTDLKAFNREVEDKAPHPFNSNAAHVLADEGGDMTPDAMNSGSARQHRGEANLAGALISSSDSAKVEVPKQRESTVPTAEVVEQVQASQAVFQPEKTSNGTVRKHIKRGPVSMGRSKPRSAKSVTARVAVSFEEVTALDAENKRLKRLVAEQLLAQNLQLTKMLERFDAV
ncbi:hypothetical protein HFO56_37585 [Rhizobium laguerreae]|uniref:hypothetical protein n=1 Tax=Rhizobium laguerreae TaxID=1076926 RepID=UPI001C906ABC|nr:hypothetical protein [Rhizobium laguerreae]MBY3158022.1 hypothetical protein [Rhizobium laguerreae]